MLARVPLFIAIILSLTSLPMIAQDNDKCRWVKVGSSPVLLDTLSVLPESIFIDKNIPYEYNINTGNIQFLAPSDSADRLLVDSVKMCYKTIPISLHLKVQNRDVSVYDSSAFFEDNRARYGGGLFAERNQIFPSEGLNKNGSISRGISFGNTQDVFVNSALNLQLDGKLTDDINIRAAITDQNIPFQPEGNTQQLQEFDKVFIQFYNDYASLTAGDILLQNKPSNFLKFYKNVQGGKATVRYSPFKNSNAETGMSISVAKGKFASEQVSVKEGVLGPYKLRGSQNEPFIIVLANSEKVYLDGKLLVRGYDYDYTIDYNQGEITFTNRVLITIFSRVRVDYEYSDRNYSRTIISGDHHQAIGKVNLYTNFYSEKDNANRPLSFDLSNSEKVYLSEIGDDLERAVISGVDSIPYNPNLILYKQVDTANSSTPVYFFTTNPDSARFDVSFSDVGVGNGNYRLTNRNVNGRIYEWVDPIEGIPQGRYEPVIAIPTPSQKQMVTAGGEIALSAYETAFSEVAFSNNDINLYSQQDEQDNQGFAYKGGFLSKNRPVSFLKGYKWNAAVDYEFNENTFQAVDRFRYIEFDRNWNVVPSDSLTLYDENIFNVSLGIIENPNNLFNYRMVRRKRGEAVDGYQHYVDFSKSVGRLQMVSSVYYLKSEQLTSTSDWKKLDGVISYNSKIFVPGYQYSIEQNEIRSKSSDSLTNIIIGLPVPLNYNAHTFFLRSNDSLSTKFNLNYTIREDKQPLEGEMKLASKSETTNFSFQNNSLENHDINFTFTYRTLENLQKLAQQDLEETIMGRIDWFADFFDDHIRSELTYAIANAQEPRREFVYLKVPTGEGTHTWRDENEDEIQDINEFYEAINADERNYIKIFVPTDEYLLAYSSNLNYRFNFSMPRNWRADKGFKSFLSKFSNVTAWSIDKKHTDNEVSARFLPFGNAIEDENLLAIRESLRSTLFFDRSNPKFGLDGALVFSERKELLTNGFDTRKNNEFHTNARVNIKRSYNFRLGAIRGELSNSSDFLEGRNYQINFYEINPEFEWMPVRNFRLSTKYAYSDKENVFDDSDEFRERAKINSFGIEGRFTQVSKRTMNFGLKYISIAFEGQENTPVGYELLEALSPGDNYTWNFNLQQRVAEGLQMSVHYEGRKSGEQAIIHIGRMQISALF